MVAISQQRQELGVGAGETLLRLTYVLLRRRNGLRGPSVWADVEATPTRMGEVLKGIRQGFTGDGDMWEQFRDLVYSADVSNRDDPDVISGVTTFAEWFNFSVQLFARRPT